MNSQFKEPYRLSNAGFTNLIAVFLKNDDVLKHGHVYIYVLE